MASGSRWTRSDRLTVFGIVIAVLGLAAAFMVVPEARRFFGLEENSQAPVTGNATGSASPEFERASKSQQFRLAIRQPEDVCRLVEFLQLNIGDTVSLSLDFIKKEYGGVTTLNEATSDPSGIAVEKACGGAVEEGKGTWFIFRIDQRGQYFWNRNERGDGLVLEGTFVPNWIQPVGQGYYQIALTSI